MEISTRINEYRKYTSKKKVFHYLLKYYDRRRKLMSFVEKQRGKMLNFFFTHFKETIETQIEQKNENSLWVMNIFHQWKLLTKMKKFK